MATTREVLLAATAAGVAQACDVGMEVLGVDTGVCENGDSCNCPWFTCGDSGCEPAGALIGVIVALVVLLIACIACCCYCCRKEKTVVIQQGAPATYGTTA